MRKNFVEYIPGTCPAPEEYRRIFHIDDKCEEWFKSFLAAVVHSHDRYSPFIILSHDDLDGAGAVVVAKAMLDRCDVIPNFRFGSTLCECYQTSLSNADRCIDGLISNISSLPNAAQVALIADIGLNDNQVKKLRTANKRFAENGVMKRIFVLDHHVFKSEIHHTPNGEELYGCMEDPRNPFSITSLYDEDNEINFPVCGTFIMYQFMRYIKSLSLFTPDVIGDGNYWNEDPERILVLVAPPIEEHEISGPFWSPTYNIRHEEYNIKKRNLMHLLADFVRYVNDWDTHTFWHTGGMFGQILNQAYGILGSSWLISWVYHCAYCGVSLENLPPEIMEAIYRKYYKIKSAATRMLENLRLCDLKITNPEGTHKFKIAAVFCEDGAMFSEIGTTISNEYPDRIVAIVSCQNMQISFRSAGEVSCIELATILGGGGHPHAAGARLKQDLFGELVGKMLAINITTGDKNTSIGSISIKINE